MPGGGHVVCLCACVSVWYLFGRAAYKHKHDKSAVLESAGRDAISDRVLAAVIECTQLAH